MSFDASKYGTLYPVLEGHSSKEKERGGLVRAIGNLYEFFTIAAYSPVMSTPRVRRLMFQYNITLNSDFYIANINAVRAKSTSSVLNGTLCIKYRIGSTVYRYILIGDTQNLGALYSNQLIKKNFVIEYWCNSADVILPKGIQYDITFQMSTIIRPSSVNQSDVDNGISNSIQKNVFGVLLPEVLPYTQDDQVWLTN